MKTVEVKICGLTNRDDVLAAIEYGADYLGFIFYAGSPRAISATKVVNILDRITLPVKPIGVFVNANRRDIELIASDCVLHAVQLHGNENPLDFADMQIPIWRAVKVGKNVVRPSPGDWQAARFLIDAAVPGKYGGTGELADWETAAALAAKHPVMLAGGLTPDNVAEAVRIVRPIGVDVVSGVESLPGKKDKAKLKRFIEAAKS